MRLSFIVIFLFLSFTTKAVEIRIATAANFYPTLNKVKLAYEKASEHKITIIRGSTGKLFAQIMHGAPYDIFFSADSHRADRLVKMGRTLDKSAMVYATGQLALWKPDAESSQALREQLINGNFNKLAIANPKTAPYGKAAIETLKAMELYEEVKSKLVFGENISQALQFVETGAADIGFVARPYVNDDIYWEIEPYQHRPIKQKMVVLKAGKQPEIVKDFISFLKSDEMQRLIKEDGYLL